MSEDEAERFIARMEGRDMYSAIKRDVLSAIFLGVVIYLAVVAAILTTQP